MKLGVLLMAVNTKKRATYTDNDKNGNFVDAATEKTVKYAGEKIKKNIKHNIEELKKHKIPINVDKCSFLPFR